jgi:hypothetical protein
VTLNHFKIVHPLDDVQALDGFQPDKKPSTPACPRCLTNRRVVRTGQRHTKAKGRVQRYKCNLCRKQFTDQAIAGTKHPLKIIAFALTYYNQGHSYQETRDTIKRKLKRTVPVPTIQTWARKHAGICTFIPMRKRYDIQWKKIIRKRKLYHQQIYEFKYHTLKTNIAAKYFRQIRYYLEHVYKNKKETQRVFERSTTRCSTFKPPNQRYIDSKTILSNNATKMTKLALTLAKNKAKRHEAVESFFIANDSSTIAVEIPVYILPNDAPDLRLTEPLTGHIDILQFRNKKIQVLDYKPDQNPKLASMQLYLYKRALAIRARIPQDRIQTAAFNEDRYVEFN